MLRSALVLVVLLATGACSSSSKTAGAPTTATSTVPPSNALTTFTDQAGRFNLAYPASWTSLKPSDPSAHLLLSAGGPGGLDSLQVRVQPAQVAVGTTTSGVADVKALADTIMSGTPVKVLQQRAVTLDGLPAYYYLYTLTDAPSGQELVHAHYFLLDGRSLILLVFQAVTADFTKLATTFDQVVASFHRLP